VNYKSISVWTLLFSNLLFLIGIYSFNWDWRTILIVYWFENVVIGLSSIIKMVTVILTRKNYINFFNLGFFIIHYGLFTVIHGIFLFILILDIFGMFEPPSPIIWSSVISGSSILILSHFISLIYNFYFQGEVRKATIEKLTTEPYIRIIVMHLVVLFSVIFALLLEKFIPLLSPAVFIVVIKTVVDLLSHKHEHKKYAKISLS